jgi:hypothetical protein
MASSPSAIQRHFRSVVSPASISGLATCIWAAYPEAQRICGEHLLRDQVHDVRGHFRRGLIELYWKNYARRIPGAVVRQETNSIGSSKHLVIEIDGVILTQSLADGPNDVIQQANFRNGYAEISQINLFADPDEVRRAHQTGKLYAMFLHGVSTNPKQPRFMAIVFPTKHCEAYVSEATIDVLSEFGDLAHSIRSERTEDIGDDLMLELRRIDEGEESATA